MLLAKREMCSSKWDNVQHNYQLAPNTVCLSPHKKKKTVLFTHHKSTGPQSVAMCVSKREETVCVRV